MEDDGSTELDNIDDVGDPLDLSTDQQDRAGSVSDDETNESGQLATLRGALTDLQSRVEIQHAVLEVMARDLKRMGYPMAHRMLGEIE